MDRAPLLEVSMPPWMNGLVVLAVTAVFATACEDKAATPAPSRFASVKREASSQAAKSFCDQQWAVGAEGQKPAPALQERPIPGVAVAKAKPRVGAWRWINLWATWCVPCVEEMGLLGKWKQSLEKDGVPVELELWSVDDEEEKLTTWLRKTNMPGPVRWVQDDVGVVLESLGAQKTSAIPVHALVDPSGNLRCLRVGAVHEEDYGAIKAILTGA